jgi:hypothetical protein
MFHDDSDTECDWTAEGTASVYHSVLGARKKHVILTGLSIQFREPLKVKMQSKSPSDW